MRRRGTTNQTTHQEWPVIKEWEQQFERLLANDNILFQGEFDASSSPAATMAELTVSDPSSNKVPKQLLDKRLHFLRHYSLMDSGFTNRHVVTNARERKFLTGIG